MDCPYSIITNCLDNVMDTFNLFTSKEDNENEIRTIMENSIIDYQIYSKFDLFTIALSSVFFILFLDANGSNPQEEKELYLEKFRTYARRYYSFSMGHIEQCVRLICNSFKKSKRQSFIEEAEEDAFNFRTYNVGINENEMISYMEHLFEELRLNQKCQCSLCSQNFPSNSSDENSEVRERSSFDFSSSIFLRKKREKDE